MHQNIIAILLIEHDLLRFYLTVVLATLLLSQGIAIYRTWNKAFLSIDPFRTAVHETGHLLAAWSSSETEDISATIVPRSNPEDHFLWKLVRGSAGQVCWHWRGSFSTTYTWWANLVISLAGAAAESQIYGTINPRGLRSDRQMARESTRVLLKYGETIPPWSTTLELDPASRAAFDTILCQGLTEPEKELMRCGYVMAHQLLFAHSKNFNRIISLLVDKRNLTEQDVEPILGPRCFIKLEPGPFVLDEAA